VWGVGYELARGERRVPRARTQPIVVDEHAHAVEQRIVDERRCEGFGRDTEEGTGGL
jgi:hypothetical protein